MTYQEQMRVLQLYRNSVEMAKKVRMTGNFATQFNIIGSKTILPILIAERLGKSDDDVKNKSHDMIIHTCNELQQSGERVLAVVSLRDIKYRLEKDQKSMIDIPPSARNHENAAIMATCSTKEDTVIHFFPYLISEGRFTWLLPINKQVEEVEIADIDLTKLFPDGL